MTRVGAPAAAALREHGDACPHCLAMAKAGRPYTKFCPVGRPLAQDALKELVRSRRRAS